jgi:hypothetical protein
VVVRRAMGQMLSNPVIGEALAAVVPAPTAAQLAAAEREGDGLGALGSGDSYGGYGVYGQQAAFEQQQEEERRRRVREEEESKREAPMARVPHSNTPTLRSLNGHPFLPLNSTEITQDVTQNVLA